MPMSLELDSERSKIDVSSGGAWQTIQTIFNVLNHIIILIVAVYMSYVSYNTGNRAISWHVFLCTLGYQLLMTQSILAFYSQNVWSKEYARPTQRTFHWVLQAIGSTMAITGMVIEFIGRSQKNKNHIISTHSTIGLIAGIFTLVGMFNGVSALWSVELRKYVRPVYLKLLHNLNGIAAFVLGMVALYYGYDKGYMVENARSDVRMGLQAFAIISIILSLLGAVRAAYNHIQNVVTN